MLTVKSPHDGSVVVQRNYAGIEDIKKAVKAAMLAKDAWSKTSLEERCRICRDSLIYMRELKDEIGKEISLQMGRPIKYSSKEVDGYIERATYMIDIAKDSLVDKEVTDMKDPSIKKFMSKDPLGLIFILAAWNYPLLIAVNSVIPALCAGNVVILKHSAQTPLCSERIVESLEKAGVPPGVIQYLHLSHESTDLLIKNPYVSFVQFTGSVSGGRTIQSSASESFIGVGLELGGCDAAFVRSDADLKYTASNLADGAFFNTGQCCCGIQRIFVHESVYEEFLCQFKKETIAQFGSMGDPLDPNTTLGPCIKPSVAEELKKLIKEDENRGAIDIMKPDRNTYYPLEERTGYMSPRIMTEVQLDMNVMKDEMFGPVVGIVKVKSDEEAIEFINANSFGLTASIWTKDHQKARLIGKELQVGTVFQNRCDYLDPSLAWVGVKNSGRGCSLSTFGYDQLTRLKSYHLKQ